MADAVIPPEEPADVEALVKPQLEDGEKAKQEVEVSCHVAILLLPSGVTIVKNTARDMIETCQIHASSMSHTRSTGKI